LGAVLDKKREKRKPCSASLKPLNKDQEGNLATQASKTIWKVQKIVASLRWQENVELTAVLLLVTSSGDSQWTASNKARYRSCRASPTYPRAERAWNSKNPFMEL